ncbi:hemerythrin [Elusimicrobium simillimum]
MKYEWSAILETGHKQVDRQHKLLIETLNELQTAFEENRG